METRLTVREFLASTASLNGAGYYELTIPADAELDNVVWPPPGQIGVTFHYQGKKCSCALRAFRDCTVPAAVEK